MLFKLFCKYFSFINLHGQTIILDSFCGAIKIIPATASVHTQERLWRRDLCDGGGVASRRSPKSGASHIGWFLCLTLEQDLCRPGPLLQLWIPFRGASKKCLGTPSSLVPRRFLGSSRLIAAREHV